MFQKYIDFIFTQIISDADYLMFDSDHWWNFFILPYSFWIVIFILKYTLLTIPIWLPPRAILFSIKENIRPVKNLK